jgi:hypothetical protein
MLSSVVIVTKISCGQDPAESLEKLQEFKRRSQNPESLSFMSDFLEKSDDGNVAFDS